MKNKTTTIVVKKSTFQKMIDAPTDNAALNVIHDKEGYEHVFCGGFGGADWNEENGTVFFADCGVDRNGKISALHLKVISK